MTDLIYLLVNNNSVKVDTMEFSDGALRVHVDVNDVIQHTSSGKINNIRYVVNPQTKANDVIMLVNLTHSVVCEHTSQLQCVEHVLFLKYLPYARADRKFSDGEPKSPLDRFLNLLPPFDRIDVIDPHNERAFLEAVGWKDVEIQSQENVLRSVIQRTPRLQELKDFALVAPDKGSVQKINKVLAMFQQMKVYPSVILADKVRDPETGKITKMSLPPVDLSGMTCLIVDDICDGGGTFIGLAKLLKEKHNAKTVILYVTHGIFSKGLRPFKSAIDEIYYYQLAGNAGTYCEAINAWNTVNLSQEHASD